MKHIIVLVFIIFGIVYQAFAQVPPPPPPVKESGDYIIVEQSPRFPGCEDILDKGKKETCSNEKMLEFIYSNLKYPNLAKENGIEGHVVIQFVITKYGTIEDINLVRDLQGGCGNAALKVIHAMSELPDKWIPGVQGGRKVNVKYTIPIKFELEKRKKWNWRWRKRGSKKDN